MMHVWRNSKATGNDRLVLLAIADEANDKGNNAFPSVRRLASKANCSKNTVTDSIKRLEALRELVAHRPEKQGRGRFNTYEVVMERVQDSDPLSNDPKASLVPVEASLVPIEGAFGPTLTGTNPILTPTNPNTYPDSFSQPAIKSIAEPFQLIQETEKQLTPEQWFERAWASYPKGKSARPGAEKGFIRHMLREGVDPKRMIQATANYREFVNAKREADPEWGYLLGGDSFFGAIKARWRDYENWEPAEVASSRNADTGLVRGQAALEMVRREREAARQRKTTQGADK